MKLIASFLIVLFFNSSLVLSKHKKHELGLRGNNNTAKVEIDFKQRCDLVPEYCGDSNITLPEKIHCSLNSLFQNNTNVSGTILFYSNGTDNSFTILESNSNTNTSFNDDLTLIRVVEETLNSTIIDIIGNGSLIKLDSEQNNTIENIGISSFLDKEYDLLNDIDKFSKIYADFGKGGIGLIDTTNNSSDSLFIENESLGSVSNITDGELIDNTVLEDYNSTIEVLEEIVTKFPDLRELSEIVKGERRDVSIRDLLDISSRLMRNLYDPDNLDKIDDQDIDKLRERLSESEIDKLKDQQNETNVTVVTREPWYSPLKKFGIGIISGQNPIFSSIIAIVESIVGVSPIGSIISVIVRVIAAIVTIIHEIIQKRKSNENLVRVLKSLDKFEVSEVSKTKLANKLIDRITVNVDIIQRSQFYLRSLYMDLSELAHNAQHNLHDAEDKLHRESLDNFLNGTLMNMLSNTTHKSENLLEENVDRNSLLIRNLGLKILTETNSFSKPSSNRNTFERLGDEIELFLNESYELSWGEVDVRNLNSNDIDLNSNDTNLNSNDTNLNSNDTVSNSTIIADNSTTITTTSTSLTTQSTKVKWYDGLIEFSKKVSEMSGIASMLDMLLELFTVIFGNSPKAESILSVLRLVVYLIKSIFNIFGNISSSRKLITMTKVIPNDIANNRSLLQLTLKRIQENMNIVENERKVISSNVEEVASMVHELSGFDEIDKEFENYLTYNASESENGNYTYTLGINAVVHSKLEEVERYLESERLLSASESTSMSMEINFNSLIGKLGALFENSYSKLKQVLMTIFSTIFKGSKIISFIEKLLDLIVAVLKSIYHIFKNKSAQRLLIQSIEECEDIGFQEILHRQLEAILKTEDTSVIVKLLN